MSIWNEFNADVRSTVLEISTLCFTALMTLPLLTVTTIMLLAHEQRAATLFPSNGIPHRIGTFSHHNEEQATCRQLRRKSPPPRCGKATPVHWVPCLAGLSPPVQEPCFVALGDTCNVMLQRMQRRFRTVKSVGGTILGAHAGT
jgi:hypothetical protein